MRHSVNSVTKAARVARLLLMASALCLAAASNSRAACLTIHTLTPTTCGVVISAAGCYNVPSVSLTATTDAGDCVQITAPNVYLNLNGSSITGTGATSTGNGIHVTSTAAGATIVGAGYVTGFNVGILAEARVRLESPYAYSNNTDGIKLMNAASSKIVSATSTSNGGNGVTVTGSNTSVLASVNASSNTGSGIVVNTSNAGSITNPSISSNGSAGLVLNTVTAANISVASASSNGTYGIELINSKANKILSSTTTSNGIYGVYVKSSAANVLAGSNASYYNVVADVYLGCSDTTGPNGIACAVPSSTNELDVQNTYYGYYGTSYGIAIDLGNKGNTVLGSSAYGHAIDDMYDANTLTGNTWFGNTFNTANVSFIH